MTVGVDVSNKLTPFKLSEARVVKINDEPSSSVPVKTSPSLRVKGEERSLNASPFSENSPPEMLTVLPLSVPKLSPNVPPEMLTVLPRLASNS